MKQMELLEMISSEEVKNKNSLLLLEEKELEKYKKSTQKPKIRIRNSNNNQLEYIFVNLDDFIKENDTIREINNEIDFSFDEEEIAKCYKNGTGPGAPAVDPEKIARQLFCFLFYNIKSERQLEDETNVNLKIRWFCKYPLSEKIPDHSTISIVRKRFLENSTGPYDNPFDKLLSRVIQQSIEKGYLSNEASIDRSNVISPETPLTSRERALILTREIIRVIELGDEIDKILEKDSLKNTTHTAKISLANIITEITKVDKRSKFFVLNEAKEMIEKELAEVIKDNNNKKRKNGVYLLPKWRIDEKLKEKLKRNIKTFIEVSKKLDDEFKDKFGKTYETINKNVKDVFSFLSVLKDLCFGKIKRITKKTASDCRDFLKYLKTKKSDLMFEIKKMYKKLVKTLNEILKDMPQSRGGGSARFGHTSRVNRFFGSNVTFISDHKNGLITSVEVSPGDDSRKFFESYNQHKNRVGSLKSLCADAEYDEKEIRKTLKEDGVTGYISQKPIINPRGKFDLRKFKFDEEGNVICPANKTMKKIGNSNIYKGVGCSNCIIKHKCTEAKTRHVKLNKEEIDEYEKITEFNKTEEYKLQKKKRLIAEGIIGHNKEHHGLRKWHYRDPRVQRMQAVMTAIVHNAEKIVRLKIKEKLKKLEVEKMCYNIL